MSAFDADPMPRVDELIERLGPARYLTTLDLTRSAREKTAFATPARSARYFSADDGPPPAATSAYRRIH